MKKYGQADLMIALIHEYIWSKMKAVTDSEKIRIEEKCCEKILAEYPSTRDLEVGR